MVAATRRTLLTRASAAGLAGAVVLSGCGSSHHRRRHRLTRAHVQDAALLNAALAIEQRSIAAYTAATPLLNGVAGRAAARFLGQELQHAGELRQLIGFVGGRPHEPAAHYDFGQPHGVHELLELLHALEQAQLAAYLDALPRLSTPFQRQAVASILANDAQHITVLRSTLGLPALDGAFVIATE